MNAETLSPLLSPVIPSVAQPSATAAASRRRVWILLVVFALLAGGWAAYADVTSFDFIAIDDPGYVYLNSQVQQGLTWPSVWWSFTSMDYANWHPLTWLTLLVDYQCYGLNAGGYHLTNWLLHELASILLFAWLLVATRRLGPSALVAILFCIHPAHVESVAWVTERKDVLSTVFFFGVLLAYTRYAQTGGRRFYLAAQIGMILGLLAKPMLVTLPAVLLLLDFWPLARWRRFGDFWKLLWEKAPFIVLSAASCVITFIAQHAGGATVSLDTVTVPCRIGNCMTAYVSYLGKLFWPSRLGVFYPYQVTPSLAVCLACAGTLLVVTIVAATLFRRLPFIIVGWLWFLGTLVPVIGLVQVGSQAMADRYTYQPSVGIFMAVCWLGAELWNRWPRLRTTLVGVSLTAVTACLLLCAQQVAYWRNSTLLFQHTLAITRSDFFAYNILGDFFYTMHYFDESEAAYRAAFKLRANDVNLVIKLGYVQLDKSHWGQAAAWLQQAAVRENFKDPLVYDNLGLALYRVHRYEAAADAFRRSLQIRPDHAASHRLLADSLLASGSLDEAAAEYDKTLALQPDDDAALASLAWLYSFVEHGDSPDHVQTALTLAERAVSRGGPGSVESHDALAAAYAAAGDWPNATQAAEAARVAAGNQPGASSDFVQLHDARVEAYRAGKWPAR